MGKRRRRFGYTVAALLLIGALLAWDGRVAAMIRFVRDAHEPGLGADFGSLEKMLPGEEPDLPEMYAGLPHPFFQESEFIWKLWTTSNRSIHGYRFYRKPITPSAAVQTTIVGILSKKESYRAYRGAKACGGFHADFAARLESGGKSTWFLVCLGCGEVLVYSDEGALICELERDAERRLDEAWKDHRGIPFVSFESRLPIENSKVSAWGFYFNDAWDSNPVEWRNRGVPVKAFARKQSLALKRAPDDLSGPSIRLGIEEETYETPELAELRIRRYFEAVDRAPRRDSRNSESDPAVVHPPKAGFSHGKHVYWIKGEKNASQEMVQRALDLLRRHCEETGSHEVRAYR